MDDDRPSPYDGPAGHDLARSEAANEVARRLEQELRRLPWRHGLRRALVICHEVGREYLGRSEARDG